MNFRVRVALVLSAMIGFAGGCKDASNSPVVNDTATAEPVDEPSVLAPEFPLVMLTPTEYNNTVRDLFGFPNRFEDWPEEPPVVQEIQPPEADNIGIFGGQVIPSPTWPREFPEELGVHDFEGMAEGQVSSAYALEEYQKSALKLAPYALVSPIFFTCANWEGLAETERKSCGWESVERLAQRAWRRPLVNGERTRLEAFWNENWASVTPEQAVVLTVAGLLQAPAFLFRIEEDPISDSGSLSRKLSGWEMASKLSYFLWDSMPDQALFAAASEGELDSVEGVEEQARRLLGDPRARSMMVHFHHQWLQTDQVLGISPARSAFGPVFGISPYPALDTTDDGLWPARMGPIRHSLHQETSLFVTEVIFDGEGTFEALLTSDKGYRSQVTTPIYGENVTPREGETISHSYSRVVQSIGSTSSIDLEPITFAPSERAGVLTLPSFMAIGAYAVHPAPVIRGVRLLERLVCQTFGSPPPGAEASVPPDALDVESTNRQRTEQATADIACAGCHDTINPPGFAFENYDALGMYRVEDNGLPVDASGSVTLWGGEELTFTDGVDLSRKLAGSDRARDCYTLHWVRYATGVDFVEGDEGLAELQSLFRENDNIVDLLVSITTSDLFRYRGLTGGEE